MAENIKFGNIFKRIGSLVFTEEYLQTENPADNKPEVKDVKTALNSQFPAAPQNTGGNFFNAGTANNDMIKKVYSLLGSINKPGIDFMELWDAVEAMGGTTPQNINNAFVALKIASGNTLSKQLLLSSGNEYGNELKRKLELDINEKVEQKNTLLYEKKERKESLTSEIQQLTDQMQKLQATLLQKQNELNQIETTYLPRVHDIDTKILGGENAVKTVYGEIQKMLSIIENTVKE
jgi:hypothetical protein